ncbi:unnamed protein product [Brassica oleracea var. botrytis]|uniref:BnaC01g27830D protein n=3 Tax=Brassica TaxID=3705 RepID=A0A078IBZ5_BRANA|nr:hypothetical protein HID58_065897 [Brassica napus]CAF1928152.1 unnamed protein product [Brassica napus]CAF2075349.1 unnamed protein product [Brassica napus]CDY46879.1 BnaC01g27830D [Brassica napus]VDD51158.1 unnamed protein product [Brassica oleracea]
MYCLHIRLPFASPSPHHHQISHIPKSSRIKAGNGKHKGHRTFSLLPPSSILLLSWSQPEQFAEDSYVLGQDHKATVFVAFELRKGS